MFLTLVLTGLRRSELQALRWRDVDLIESVLRVRDSKSEDGIRSIALSPALAEELWQHRGRSLFRGDDERVFDAPTGGVYRRGARSGSLTDALAIGGRLEVAEALPRPQAHGDHERRCRGSSPIAVMTKAGHANMSTTKRYLHLAGVVFRDEADALERRLLGGAGEPYLLRLGPVASPIGPFSLSTPRGSAANNAARHDRHYCTIVTTAEGVTSMKLAVVLGVAVCAFAAIASGASARYQVNSVVPVFCSSDTIPAGSELKLRMRWVVRNTGQADKFRSSQKLTWTVTGEPTEPSSRRTSRSTPSTATRDCGRRRCIPTPRT